MTVESQVCPQCGAAVQFNEGQAEAVCSHCGTTVVKPGSVQGAGSVEKELAAEKLVQETVEREKKLRHHGRPATAKIVTAQATDIYRATVEGRAVLMDFSLTVEPEGEEAFNAEGRALVGLTAVDKYRPGTLLDVYFNPDDRALVAIEGRHGVTIVTAADRAEKRREKEKARAERKEAEAEAIRKFTPPAAAQPAQAWSGAQAPLALPEAFAGVTGLGAPRAIHRRQDIVLFPTWGGAHPKVLVIYADGLAFHVGGKQAAAWRWQEIAGICTRDEYSKSSEHASVYTLHEYVLLRGDGEKLFVDFGLENVEGAIAPIKKAVFDLLWPDLSSRYGAGEAIAFGPVSVDKTRGLETGGRLYGWSAIADVKVDHGHLFATLSDGHKLDVHTRDIPNIELLCRLIGVNLADYQLTYY